MFTRGQSGGVMAKSAAVHTIRGIGWLATLPADLQDAVIGRSDLIAAEAGQSLFEAGDATGGIYGVVEGRIDLHLPAQGDAPTLASSAGPGAWIGDLAAVSGADRMLSLIAGTPTRALRLSRAEMLRLVQDDPANWFHFAALLATNMARALATIDMLRRDRPIDRVAALLQNLIAMHAGADDAIAVSQGDLAAMAALSRTTVNTALLDLEQKGLVQRGYGTIRVVDRAALDRFVHRA
jgi:CRP-like cAMP-binding protein